MKVQSGTFRLTSTRAALLLSAALAAAHLAFLGAAFRQSAASRSLERDLAVIEENLQRTAAVTEDTLAGLRQQLEAAETRLAALQAAAPELGAPFKLYHHSYDLALASGVELIGVRRQGQEAMELPIGRIQVDIYQMEVYGDLNGCLELIRRLEDTGLGTVAVENLDLDPAGLLCSFDVLTVGKGQLPTP